MAQTRLATKAKQATRKEKRVAEVTAEYRDTAPVRLLSKLSDAGDQPQLRSISGGMIMAGLLLWQPRVAKAGLRMLLAHELATVIKNFVKKRVDRTRPRSAATAKDSAVRSGRQSAKEQTSFPSGHTAGAVAVAQAFAREFPEHRIAARAAAGVVGLAQIPRCAHYPTDVGVGAVIGVVAEAAVARFWRSSYRRSDRVTPAAPQPPPPRA